jgi:DNA-binding SARP family transcriptional activator
MAALRRDPSAFWSSRALQQLGVVHIRTNQAERGAFLLGCDEVVREGIGSKFFGPDRALTEESIAIGRAALGDEAFDAAWKAGRATPLETVLDEEIGKLGAVAKAPRKETAQVTHATEPPLEVRSLGRLEIRREGTLLRSDAWRYAKPRELLLYLLSHPEGRTRDQIGLVFWPDASATQVKNNFHVMLHHVRKAIGSGGGSGGGRANLIVFDEDRYRIAWEARVVFDARSFEENATAALRALKGTRAGGSSDAEAAADSLRAALIEYRGDFLAGEEVGDWHFDVRDRLRRRFGDAVMLLTRAGERSEAIKQYERLSRALQLDLEAEPERETKALYERLRRAETV